MSGLYAKALESLCEPFLPCPKSIPRAWDEMTPNEQSMTVWFARTHFNAKDLEEVARHAVARHSKLVGNYDLETANNIFSMFYNGGEEGQPYVRKDSH